MSEISREEGNAVVKPGQDIVASIARELREELKGLVAEGVQEMTMDLQGVEMVDSIGIGLLIAAHNSLAKSGGKLKVVNATPDIFKLLKTMRLDQHFEISGT
jgi:anti-anti-sigma factor